MIAATRGEMEVRNAIPDILSPWKKYLELF
jgi:hypothetical protein